MRILCLVLLCACGAVIEQPEEDPGGSTWGDDDLSAVADGIETDSEPPPGGIESFQMPFPCGQVWLGETRTDHNPMLAIDFNRADDIGDDVVAAAAGKVVRVEDFGTTSYGKWIEVDHAAGFRTRYAHLETQIVQVDQSVSAGQRLGTLGNTGGSTGPHLHYELRKNGIGVKIVFDAVEAYYYGSRSYTSNNECP